jgi:hypothetical protein
MKMVTYINVLPRELKREIEYYQNYLLWVIMNDICKKHRNYLESTEYRDKDLVINIKFTSLNITKVLKMESIEIDTHFFTSVIYYYIPNSELITMKMLLTFLNVNDFLDRMTAYANDKLKLYGYREQIMKYYHNDRHLSHVAVCIDSNDFESSIPINHAVNY